MLRNAALAIVAFAATTDAASPAASGLKPAFAAPLSLRTSSTSGVSSSATSAYPAVAGNCLVAPRLRLGKAVRVQRTTPVMMAGLYEDKEAPKATKELLQVRFAKMTAEKLKAWILKWPTGGKKDSFGIPKLMLPVTTEPNAEGLKIIFKGTEDPWLQITLEGDTVRVYRCSGLSTTSLSVSALKMREETKLCDKLREDLKVLGDMVEKEIPQVKVQEPEPKEEEDKEEGDDKEAEPATPTAGSDEPPAATV